MNDDIISLHDLQFKPYISAEKIEEKTLQIGQQIHDRYYDKCPVFLAILNGSFIFASDLVRAANIESEITFIKLSSYDGLESTGEVTTRIGLEMDLKDRHVIIVEDIVDTGKTLFEFIPVLNALAPSSIAIATLLRKPTELKHPLIVDYIGFDIPPKFVVGYGLDYNGLGRGLRDIYQLVD